MISWGSYYLIFGNEWIEVFRKLLFLAVEPWLKFINYFLIGWEGKRLERLLFDCLDHGKYVFLDFDYVVIWIHFYQNILTWVLIWQLFFPACLSRMLIRNLYRSINALISIPSIFCWHHWVIQSQFVQEWQWIWNIMLMVIKNTLWLASDSIGSCFFRTFSLIVGFHQFLAADPVSTILL
jgi:hypothetical protein